MSSISVRRPSLSSQQPRVEQSSKEQCEMKKHWLSASDLLALFGAVLVVILVKSGVLGAIPF